jgi:hypothetical protein
MYIDTLRIKNYPLKPQGPNCCLLAMVNPEPGSEKDGGHVLLPGVSLWLPPTSSHPSTSKNKLTMPRPKPSHQTQHTCQHTHLRLTPSPHAAIVGYQYPSFQNSIAATTPSGHVKLPNPNQAQIIDPAAFPAPLVLARDDLAFDPYYPPQSLSSLLREKGRNEVTAERRTIYVAVPPEVGRDVGFLRGWWRGRWMGRRSRGWRMW